MTTGTPRFLPHSAHWGVFSAAWDGHALAVKPDPDDPDPNPLIDNFPDALRHRVRVAAPMVRKGWLERGPGPDPMRGRDGYVAMPWNEVLDLLAKELQRVRDEHGPGAVFGGSYGWSSAGRFHHAQSQVHRFLNTVLGGYVRSVNNYSAGASGPMLPHVIGPLEEVARRNVTWEQIVEHTDVVLAFGGMALKNSRVASGGISRHIERNAMRDAAARGCRFVSVSPLRSDLPDEARFEWLPAVPNTDTALMLALVHQLVSDGTHDRAFIARCCDGWERFEDYLMGRSDGVAKSCAWAAPICGLPAQQLSELARSLVGKRTLVVVSHSLQRAEHGEQPVWMGAVLAAALGQLGLPGGGYNYALGTLAHYGKRNNAVPAAALPQGTNGVKAFIPVARISDMLLNPGQPFEPGAGALIQVRQPLARGTPFAESLARAQPLGQVAEDVVVVAAGRGLPQARYLRRARDRLDRHRPARRHRAALHDDAGTRGHRRDADRPDDGGHAPHRRTARREPRRLRHLLRPGRAPGRARGLQRRPHDARMAGAPV